MYLFKGQQQSVWKKKDETMQSGWITSFDVGKKGPLRERVRVSEEFQ